MHRVFLNGNSLKDFSLALKRLAASRIETRGFKSISVFMRPLEDPGASAGNLKGTKGSPQNGGSTDPDGAEVLVIEEWLDPLAAEKKLDIPKAGKRHSQSNDMSGSLWVCMAPGSL